MPTGLIKYIVIIIIILVAVFFSQQAFFREIGKNLMSGVTKQASQYMVKGSNWTASTVMPKISGAVQNISGAVQNGGDAIKKEIVQEKQNVSENIGQKISNYFSGVTESVLHPGTPQNCPAPAQTSTNN